jgi:F-type H+-transporting ATPase subunit epsilon
MAMTVHCDIVSAQEQIFSGLVESVVATGSQGELGIFPSHAALLTELVPGPVKVKLQNGTEEIYFVSGGYLEVQPNVVTVLADTAIRAADIDEAAAEEARKLAEQTLASKSGDLEYATVQADLARAVGQLRTLRRSKNL